MDLVFTSGNASRPNGGGNSTSPQYFLHIYSAVESSLAAKSNMNTVLLCTTWGKDEKLKGETQSYQTLRTYGVDLQISKVQFNIWSV